MSDRAAMRTISCATAVSSACSSSAQLRDALRQALLHRRAPFVGRDGNELDETRDERAPLIQIGAEVMPFGRSHRVEIGERRIRRLARAIGDLLHQRRHRPRTASRES